MTTNKMMQFVGVKKYKIIGDVRIFVSVTKTVYSDGFRQVCSYVTPIDPKDFQYYIDMAPCCGRYEVTQYGDVFEANEAHRDAYPYHLPGFHIIKNLSVGDIIPLYGFDISHSEVLSAGDMMIIKKTHTIDQIKNSISCNMK